MPPSTHTTDSQGGLSKLADAAEKVDDLSRSAQAQRELLTSKQQQADAALASIQVRCQPLACY